MAPLRRQTRCGLLLRAAHCSTEAPCLHGAGLRRARSGDWVAQPLLCRRHAQRVRTWLIRPLRAAVGFIDARRESYRYQTDTFLSRRCNSLAAGQALGWTFISSIKASSNNYSRKRNGLARYRYETCAAHHNSPPSPTSGIATFKAENLINCCPWRTAHATSDGSRIFSVAELSRGVAVYGDNL